MSTLSDYLEIVQNEVDDTSALAREIISQNIVEIYDEIMGQCHRYITASSSTDTTATASDASYTASDLSITTGFSDILGVFWKSSGGTMFDRLSQITEEEYLNYHINDTSSTPSKFYLSGQTINLVPAPSEAGTIRVVYTPLWTPLDTDGTVTSILPARYTDVLKLGSVYRYQAWDKDPSTPEYLSLYQQALRKMVLDLSGQTRMTKPMFYGR